MTGMDEGLLNDLLECSVCLERLDTSSRVLPCQHTFCLKCIKVIVESHKELRCPECRVLVDTKVEELPPNVLLMRILEGMKNSAPRKVATQRLRTGHAQNQLTQQTSRLDKQMPHGRAMYDYISKEPGDLSFKKGDTIIFQKKLDPFWYHGECSGRSGIFPISYVQVVVPLPVATALCKALYDFRMSAPDEEGCLAFDKGAIITVHRRVDENWAEGRLEQRVGIFPIAFVELNQAARQLMNSTPVNRPVPPIPDQVRAGHSEHKHSQHPHKYQQMSVSTPTAQGNYQNIAAMSQSQPTCHSNMQVLAQPSQILAQPSQILAPASNQHVPRNIMEPAQMKYQLDRDWIMSFINKAGVQSGARVEDSIRLFVKMHKLDSTYQNVRTHEHFPATTGFNSNISSDSSSSMNTPGSTTTPNTSSNTSTCESAEPSLPSSPDNNTERNTTVVASGQEEAQHNQELNASMGVLSLNESSTATNTSLNVSLPSESPKLNASSISNGSQNQVEQDAASNSEPTSLPCSSKNIRSSGPDSILNFGLGLQAALSPSHSKDSNYMAARAHREHHHREKRHSLTPASHLQGNHTQNRHSAEIIATSLLDHAPERERDRERERERRRRRSRSNERPLPAAYVALYPYRPQKPDELELRKGGMYTVRERCRDGWYKGWCERLQRAGVFPGNYVAPLAPAPAPAAAPVPAAAQRHKHDRSTSSPSSLTVKTAASANANATNATNAPNAPAGAGNTLAPPDAPPRANSPLATAAQPSTYPWSAAAPQQGTPRSDKGRDKSKSEKSSISTGVSLMKRLAAMKKCKSPPPAGYSMDNPVFDDSPHTSLGYSAPPHAAHVRSGSCPSQLLRTLPAGHATGHVSAPTGHVPAPSGHVSASTGHNAALRHKERGHDHRMHSRGSGDAPWQSQHRKSQSLDVSAARRDRHHALPTKERFRCIVPYPPNSEYELELKVDDIVVVCKKRGDGWYKGTLQRTGRTGLFPASFVQSCPD